MEYGIDRIEYNVYNIPWRGIFFLSLLPTYVPYTVAKLPVNTYIFLYLNLII